MLTWMTRNLKATARCDSGAVTVDWVILTAAVVILTLAGATGLIEPAMDATVAIGAAMLDTLGFDRFPQIFGN